MAEVGELGQVWRRAMEANARYYEALGQVTTDYLKALVRVLGDVRLPGVEKPAAPPAAAPAPVPPSQPAAMVLEAPAGQSAVGAFMVQNRLSQKVAAPVVASGFLDPAGHELRPVLAFEPDVVSLAPSEQVLVRVTAAIDERLAPGVAYRGEVTIPGLSGDRVALLIRRGADADGVPAAKQRRPARHRRGAPRRR